MKKLKLKVHSDKIFAYVAMFSMVTNILSPFAALIPTAAYAEDVPAEQTTQTAEEKPSEEPAPVEEAPKEETPAEEPAPVSTEETQEPIQEEATQPETVVETPAETPAVTETVETPVETTPTEPVLTTEQPGDILPDGATDYRPEAEVGSSETTEVQEIVDPVVTEPSTTEPTAVITEPSGTEPAVVVESIIPVVETPVEVVKEYETLADGVEIKDSVESDWKVDGEKAETNDVVKLGIKYIFPLDKDVSITFTKLPKLDEDKTSLKIERVKVSDLNLPDDMKTDAEYAFDVTTGMKDGDFEYDITLPKPANQSVEVSYVEKSIEEAKTEVMVDEVKSIDETKVEQKSENTDIKVTNLDHFTIFIVTWNFPNNPDNALVDGGTVANLAKTITVVGASIISFSSPGATTNSASADHWSNGSGTRYWQVEFSSTGYSNLKIFSKQQSSDRGPKNFKVQYSINSGGTWSDVSGATITVANNFTSGVLNAVSLPSACDNQTSVLLRWVMTSITSVGGSSVYDSGTSQIDDIIVQTDGSQADLKVVKSHSPAGNANPNGLFNWVLVITNIGTASAIFANDQTILSDNLPNTNATYGAVSSVNGGGTTGTVNCSINGTKDLSCTANGSVVIPVSGTITITIPVTVGSSTGTLTNPRVINGCKVDPLGVLSESDKNNNICNSDLVTIDTNVRNPSLSNSCGLDVALVLDNSTSVGDNLTAMKDAFKNFVDVLSATPTQFSVTYFNSTASYVQKVFSGSAGDTKHAIDDVPSASGNTNWQDGLLKAKLTFDPRADVPNLIIFSSDGDPNRYYSNISNENNPTGLVNGGNVFDQASHDAAVSLANTIKNSGTRIITLGIGTGSQMQSRMVAISSSDAYYNAGNFSNLTTTLNEIVTKLCGGTISINKYIDTISESTKGGSGWTFHVDGPDSFSEDATTVNGQVNVKTNSSGSGYSVVESNSLSGYSFGSASCVKKVTGGADVPVGKSTSNGWEDITVGANDIISCDFINTTNKGSIELKKSWVGAGGQTTLKIVNVAGGSQISSVQTGISGGSPLTTGVKSVNAGTYYLSETGGLTNYDSVLTCTDNGSPVTIGTNNSISINTGQSIICTFTNTLKQAHLTLVKAVVKDNGGDAANTAWTLSASGNTNISGVTGSATVTNADVSPGTYTLSESGGPSGYTQGTYSCVRNGGNAVVNNSITLASGDTATCTITNNDVAPTLTIKKEVVNDNGGTAVVGDFTIQLDSGALSFGTGVKVGYTTTYTATPTVVANHEYTLSETDFAGYSEGTWSCTDGTQGTGLTANITLDEDEDVTCTITNNDVAPTLTIKKEVVNDNGGTAVVGDFTIQLDSGALSFGTGVKVGYTTTYTATPTVVANHEYTLSETDFAGYSEGTWSCTDGTQGTGLTANITLDEDEDVTCTITNNDVAPTLTIKKEVVNDNGGTAVVGDFTIQLDSGALSFGTGVKVGYTTTYTATPTVVANHEYTLSETDFAGYSEGTWSCTDGTQGTGLTANITLDEDEDVTCTITNNDVAPTLTIKKEVVNDNGGTAVVGDFTIQLDSGALSFGTGVKVGYTTTYTATPTVVANHEYTLSETDFAGYSEGTWSCTDGTQGTGLTANITLDEDEDVTCTITNNDVAPTLTIKKEVVNDNGGTAVVGDFTIQLDSGALSFGTGVKVGYTTTYTATPTVVANHEYTLSETDFAGYSEGTWSCTDGTQGTGLTANITLDEDEDVTCTITNNDVAPTLTIKKEVVNDNGGTAVVGDFTIQLDSGALSFGTGVKVGYTTTYTATPTVVANHEYTLSETDFAGYSEGTWSCTDGTQGTGLTANITLDEDEDVTCTITNNDVAPTLTIKKEVVNDNGGTAVVGDFTIQLDSGALSFGTGVKVGYTTTYTATPTVVANHEYTLSETDFAGYSEGTWSCTDGTQGTGLTANITLDEDEDVTCTITNNDVAPTLTIKKEVVNDNGGTAVVGDFTIQLDSGALSFGTGVKVGYTTTYTATPTVVANHEYTLSETDFAGYSEGTWSCTDGTQGTGLTANITLDEDEDVTCTITNNDNPLPKLFIAKTNDADTDKYPGGEVIFTITLWVEDASISNVIVKDLPSEGFEYVHGTAKINGLTLDSAHEPSYTSPGSWAVGTINPGEPVELTYITHIKSDTDAGLYKDLAWAVGNVVDTPTKKIYALADPEEDGYIDNTNFVGTQVNVIIDPQPTKDTVDVEETKEEVGDVLGASTELPATGASTTIVKAILLIGLVGGLLLVIGGLGTMLKNKKIIALLLLAFGMSLFGVKTAYAETVDIPPEVRIEDPKSPANKPFGVTFVVMDVLDRDMNAECYVEKPGESSFSMFGSPISVTAGGNTYVCDVTSSVLGSDGAYKFMVKVTPDSGSTVESDEVSVSYDGTGPDKPKYIEKDKKSDCKYKIDLKTADDGQTDYVEIYRDSDKEMDLNSGNLIKTHTMGSNEIYEFEDELYGADCKTQYYAVIAFDSAGNASDPRAEELVTKVTVTTTETKEEVLGALEIPGGANLPGETGAGTGTGETGGGSGSVLGEETTESTNGFMGMIKSPWFWFILIVLAYITARVIKNKNKKK